MLKTQLKFIITIVLTLGLSISFQSLIAAWQVPTTSPPNQPNIFKPINEGPLLQTKSGDLILNGPTGLTVTQDIFVSSGSIGIGTLSPTEKLDVNGNAKISGSITANSFLYSSDQNLKKNINSLGNSLEKILNLRGVSFNWKENNRKDFGLIAQEVEEIYPELVYTNNEGLKSVEYANLVGPLIEAIKEQNKKINTLDKEIDLLKNEK